MRYFIELSYNGKAYHGWQKQPNAISVQEVLEDSLSKILRQPVSVVGAGRTDTEVHARELFAHFDTEHELEKEQLKYKLNAFLPKDIAVSDFYRVTNDAHARFDAISRSYIYKVALKKDVFNYDFSYYFKLPLDVDKMNEACKVLFDYEDFKCFSRSNTDVKTYKCKILKAHWTKLENELLFEIKANRFLRNMVRAIVGTMIEVGQGKISLDEFHEIIKSRDRSKAGASVPGHALYLTNVEYPKHLFI
ncbi:tRNA pseudouridine(38-40) synthase TruA [Flavobacteriaceae sp. LMIT009]